MRSTSKKVSPRCPESEEGRSINCIEIIISISFFFFCSILCPPALSPSLDLTSLPSLSSSSSSHPSPSSPTRLLSLSPRPAGSAGPCLVAVANSPVPGALLLHSSQFAIISPPTRRRPLSQHSDPFLICTSPPLFTLFSPLGIFFFTRSLRRPHLKAIPSRCPH